MYKLTFFPGHGVGHIVSQYEFEKNSMSRSQKDWSQKRPIEELSTCLNIEACNIIRAKLNTVDWDLLGNHMNDFIADGADHFVVNYLEKIIRLPLNVLIEDKCAEGTFLLECKRLVEIFDDVFKLEFKPINS